jgi:diguanylate cyclase (GGDEF)-like protein
VFAATATARLGPNDLIGRLGGEEFAMVLHDAGRDKSIGVAEHIRRSFADAAIAVDGHAVGGTVSLGLVICEEGLVDVQTLLAHADEALYCAKERGRNRIEIASLDLVLQQMRRGAAETQDQLVTYYSSSEHQAKQAAASAAPAA